MKKYIGFLALAALLTASCGEKPVEPQPAEEADAPTLLSTSPAEGIGGLTDATLSVVFSYNQNIKCSLEGQKGVTVDGGASVDKVNAYGKDLTVTVSGLARGRSYTLFLPAGTVQGFKENQKTSQAVSFHFSMKEPDQPASAMTPGYDDAGWENAAMACRNMGVGWNLGNTLESNSGDVDNMWIEAFTQRRPTDYENAWGQTDATRALIHMFKQAGFGAIRVPVTWYPHMGTVTVTVGSDNKGHWDMSTWTGYDVDPVWMARVKEVVGYVLDEGLYCILNVHHDTGTASTGWLRADQAVYNNVRERYCSLWQQIATEFKSYDEKLIFESFNEMLDSKGTWNYSSATADAVINKYNADFVETVRATGGNNVRRNLILNTYAASPIQQVLQDFVLPADAVKDHLMAEVHSYSPYRFAFEQTNPQDNQTVFDANCDKEVRSIIDVVGTYLVGKGIPCVLGEYGADTTTRLETELAKQAACYVSQAAKYDIPCFYWMALCDGKEDRAAPRWTKPTLKDAILKAWRDNKKD